MTNKLKETMAEINESIKKDTELNQAVALITTIHGIGLQNQEETKPELEEVL